MSGPNSKYGLEDAANDTDSGTRETARSWHDARDDAQDDGQLPERAQSKSDEQVLLGSVQRLYTPHFLKINGVRLVKRTDSLLLEYTNRFVEKS